MKFSESSSQAFSDALTDLHGAATRDQLHGEISSAIEAIFSENLEKQREEWTRNLLTSEQHYAASPPPLQFVWHPLLQMLWPHAIQCFQSLKAQRAPGPNLTINKKGITYLEPVPRSQTIVYVRYNKHLRLRKHTKITVFGERTLYARTKDVRAGIIYNAPA